MDVHQALKILKDYSCIEIKHPNSDQEKEELKQAVLLITSLSEWENLGICASNSQEGFKALKNYLIALGYKENLLPQNITENNDPVYIKFNTEKYSHFISDYSGEYRGVLMTIFAEDNDQIVGTYGHLPLDLFNN